MIRALLGITALGSAGVVAVTFGLLIFGGAYIAERNYYNYMNSPDQVARIQAFNERNYELICRRYVKAGYIDRLIKYREYAWCEDFMDKM